jgi:hypothetical protein
MSDIIDLSERRNAKEAPDSEFVRKDELGRSLYLFALNYEMDGAHWASEVWAYSAEDAEARVAAMRSSLKCLGQMYAAFPA